MFTYTPGYTKRYTLQTCLSKSQTSHKLSTNKNTRVIENKDGDIISEDNEMV